MPINYEQFLELVRNEADGPFGYVFGGSRFICDPVIYMALQRASERRTK
jgi:hypothetical protein